MGIGVRIWSLVAWGFVVEVFSPLCSLETRESPQTNQGVHALSLHHKTHSNSPRRLTEQSAGWINPFRRYNGSDKNTTSTAAAAAAVAAAQQQTTTKAERVCSIPLPTARALPPPHVNISVVHSVHLERAEAEEGARQAAGETTPILTVWNPAQAPAGTPAGTCSEVALSVPLSTFLQRRRLSTSTATPSTAAPAPAPVAARSNSSQEAHELVGHVLPKCVVEAEADAVQILADAVHP